MRKLHHLKFSVEMISHTSSENSILGISGFSFNIFSVIISFRIFNNFTPHQTTNMDEDVAALVVDNGSGMCKVRNNTQQRERTTTAPQATTTTTTKLKKTVILDKIFPFLFLLPLSPTLTRFF